jgi:hypothetical protein
MLITVEDVWREGEEVVATVLDRGARAAWRFRGQAAATVALEWERAQFDRSLYAALPAGFPVPTGVPVELPDALLTGAPEPPAAAPLHFVK